MRRRQRAETRQGAPEGVTHVAQALESACRLAGRKCGVHGFAGIVEKVE